MCFIFFYKYFFQTFLSFSEFKKVKIVSDAIAKHVWGKEGPVVQSFCGDTISQLANKVERGVTSMKNFDYVIFHIGTNDIDDKASFHAMPSDYGNLVGINLQKEVSKNKHYYVSHNSASEGSW